MNHWRFSEEDHWWTMGGSPKVHRRTTGGSSSLRSSLWYSLKQWKAKLLNVCSGCCFRPKFSSVGSLLLSARDLSARDLLEVCVRVSTRVSVRVSARLSARLSSRHSTRASTREPLLASNSPMKLPHTGAASLVESLYHQRFQLTKLQLSLARLLRRVLGHPHASP